MTVATPSGVTCTTDRHFEYHSHPCRPRKVLDHLSGMPPRFRGSTDSPGALRQRIRMMMLELGYVEFFKEENESARNTLHNNDFLYVRISYLNVLLNRNLTECTRIICVYCLVRVIFCEREKKIPLQTLLI